MLRSAAVPAASSPGSRAGETPAIHCSLSPPLPCSPAPLLPRMMALSEAYQAERPNVETADLTGLVIRALGMVVGKVLRDEGDLGDLGDRGDLYSKRYLFLTTLITQAAHSLIDSNEIDIDPQYITSRKVGTVLSKMRFNKARQPHSGKKGWLVTLNEVIRWSNSYGLDPSMITGLDLPSHEVKVTNVTKVTKVTKVTHPPLNRLQGEI